jgi:hypothetical protein
MNHRDFEEIFSYFREVEILEEFFYFLYLDSICRVNLKYLVDYIFDSVSLIELMLFDDF